MIEKYVYLIAALAADKNKSPQLDLMMGFHPEEKRLLTEEEENIDHIISLIRYVRMADILSESKSDPLCKNALLWLKYFPQLKQFSIYVGDELYSKLWETVLYNQTVLRLAYVFYPPNPVKNRKEWNDIREYAHVLQHEVDASLATDSRMTGKTCWTLPIPAQSALGRIIEAKAGIDQDLKTQIGLTNYAPGLLCNYLLYRDKKIEEILDPYQFEELVGIIFADEGWKVSFTKRSRDGGKDVIAQKENGNNPIIAYIQAKRHIERNKVGISKVKEFVATVAGDNVDEGYIVTTSYFSKPATQWLKDKGGELATIELIDRSKLFTLMENIASANIPVYLKL